MRNPRLAGSPPGGHPRYGSVCPDAPSPPQSCGYRKFSFQWLKLAPFHTHVSVHRKDKNSPGKALKGDALEVIRIISATVLLATCPHLATEDTGKMWPFTG